MEATLVLITAEQTTSEKGNAIWHVFTTDNNTEDEGFCKSALKALRFAFILKARTGIQISKDALETLKDAHKAWKDAHPKPTTEDEGNNENPSDTSEDVTTSEPIAED